ncbi:hypothetical protein [Helicobacter suis]|uniref:hypothetical protein n=1 Tax=Helicobacter suis TaxID=104628 RepID=UPI0013D86768|nr:hypothetical protein [Helicobacter suis]
MNFLDRSIDILIQIFPSALFILKPEAIKEPGLFIQLAGLEKVNAQYVAVNGVLYCALMERDIRAIAKHIDPLIECFNKRYAYLDGKLDFRRLQGFSFEDYLSVFALYFQIQLARS